MGISVCNAGSTKKGTSPKYSSVISRMRGLTGGTTEATTTPSIALRSRFQREKRFRHRIPYSSAVRSRWVVRRQCETRRSSWNTPSTLLVLPMSTANSIGFFGHLSLKAFDLPFGYSLLQCGHNHGIEFNTSHGSYALKNKFRAHGFLVGT